jgi:hypothetical protein
MRSSVNKPTLRIRHAQGERLLARDLQDEHDGQSRLRELHVTALHDTWGIALGFEVQPTGNGSVLVGPGLAYDISGRQILLPAPPRPIAGPAIFAPSSAPGSHFDLVISYDPFLGQRALDLLPVPCSGLGVAGHEQPCFAWRPAGSARLGLELPLVRVQVTEGGMGPLDTSVRRYTQPLARPHIVAGITPPEQQWNLWFEDRTTGLDSTQVNVGFEMRVDTRAAGFVGVPFYFASLVPITSGTVSAALGGPPTIVGNQLTTLTSLANVEAGGFSFHVAFARQRQDDVAPAAIREVTTTIPWQVAWMGVEPVTGCAPRIVWELVLQQLLIEFPFLGSLLGGLGTR